MLLYVAYPVAYVLERIFVGDIVHQQDSHGSTIISRSDGPEAFLTSGIPNLKLDSLAFDFDRLNLEVDSNSGNEGRGE